MTPPAGKAVLVGAGTAGGPGGQPVEEQGCGWPRVSNFVHNGPPDALTERWIALQNTEAPPV